MMFFKYLEGYEEAAEVSAVFLLESIAVSSSKL